MPATEDALLRVSGAKRLVILASYEDPSGAPMAALRLANGLRARGHYVQVRFLYAYKGMDSPYFPYEIVNPTSRPSAFGYAQIFMKIVGYLRQERPDAVITFMPLANTFGQLGAVLARVRKRVVSHRSPLGTYSRVMRGIDTIMAYCGCYSDLVPVSSAVRASCGHYPTWLLARSRVVHNGLLNWEPSHLSKEEARARLDLPMSDFVLVSAGRIDPQKNLAFLLPIVAELAGVTLVIAGDGSLADEFKQGVAAFGLETRVRLLGAVPRGRVPDILQAADLFVQPSLFEGQSNALLEALHAGLPVLSSNVPEQVEAMTDRDGRVAGGVLPLHDPGAWVKAIESYQRNPALLEHGRAIARARARAFSFDRMISGFEGVLGRSRGTDPPEFRGIREEETR